VGNVSLDRPIQLSYQSIHKEGLLSWHSRSLCHHRLGLAGLTSWVPIDRFEPTMPGVGLKPAEGGTDLLNF
jgi:hypothetical protein